MRPQTSPETIDDDPGGVRGKVIIINPEVQRTGERRGEAETGTTTMMSVLNDRPIGITLEEDLLGSFGGFPEKLYLISVGDGKYAANNVTLTDGQNTNGLACFPTLDDATTYMGLLAGLNGEIVSKSFEEAREIAKSKPVLTCLLLFQGGHVVEVHFIR